MVIIITIQLVIALEVGAEKIGEVIVKIMVANLKTINYVATSLLNMATPAINAITEPNIISSPKYCQYD